MQYALLLTAVGVLLIFYAFISGNSYCFSSGIMNFGIAIFIVINEWRAQIEKDKQKT